MAALALRPATPEDIPILRIWDQDPDVIAATTDDPDEDEAFGGLDWDAELAMQSDVYRYYIAQLEGRPIGAVLIIDPHLEPTHYWGEVGPNLRAVDIWIGAEEDRGGGNGAAMMGEALKVCFADPAVTAVLIDPLASNTRAHAIYQRLGFAVVGARTFGEDDCLVHELTRAAWRQNFSGD